MAHKYANVLVHVVFSTKERRNLIPPELKHELWSYIDAKRSFEDEFIALLRKSGVAYDSAEVFG